MKLKLKNFGSKCTQKAKETFGLATIEIIVLTLVVVVLISVVVMPSLTNQISNSTKASDNKINEIINYDGK